MTNWYDSIVTALKTSIEAVFLKKADIVDNLTTNDATKVLSAKQGKSLQDSKVNINQGTTNNGKFLKVSSGNVVCESVTIPSDYVHPTTKQCNYSYSHPSEKQCNYSYTHPSAKQCNATIPSASSSTPSADVSGGAIGSSSNYAKADHQHPLSSAYATSGHNHSGTYAPVSHTQASSTITDMSTVQVVVTYTDSTSETLTLFKQVSSQ